jgi:hypothetical protein
MRDFMFSLVATPNLVEVVGVSGLHPRILHTALDRWMRLLHPPVSPSCTGTTKNVFLSSKNMFFYKFVLVVENQIKLQSKSCMHGFPTICPKMIVVSHL